ncbi:MAG: DotU family type IV/VI secretion system protein [Pseudomonadota bacterium]
MRLLDCFSELIAYTGYIIDSAATDAFAFEDTAERYRLLVARSRQCAQAGGIDDARWQQGFFAACAWIDESLLCSAWPQREKWAASQLQKQYFNTTAAGEAFYDRLDALEEDAGDLREVYAVCLALGFKGRYFRSSDLGRLEDVRYTNLKRVTEDTALSFPETLFPDAYAAPPAGKWRRKKWRGLSVFSAIVILIPVLAFAALYVFFDNVLTRTIQAYFGAGA